MSDTIGSMRPGEVMKAKRWALWVVPSRREAWLNPRYGTQHSTYVYADPNWIVIIMTEDGAEVSMPEGLRVPHTEFNPWSGPQAGYYVGDLIPVTLLNGEQMASTRATQRLEPRGEPPSWLGKVLGEKWWNPDA